MNTPKPTTDRSDMLLASVTSLLVNLGWLFIAPPDQRVILVALASIVLGMVLLAGDESGAYGMGVIFGSMAAGVIGLVLVAAGMSPL